MNKYLNVQTRNIEPIFNLFFWARTVPIQNMSSSVRPAERNIKIKTLNISDKPLDVANKNT
jgi:hypothetical protein